jgi:hypothetical protein
MRLRLLFVFCKVVVFEIECNISYVKSYSGQVFSSAKQQHKKNMYTFNWQKSANFHLYCITAAALHATRNCTIAPGLLLGSRVVPRYDDHVLPIFMLSSNVSGPLKETRRFVCKNAGFT